MVRGFTPRFVIGKYELGLSFGKIQKLLLAQYQLDVSRGVLSEIVSRTAKKFGNAYEDIKSMLLEQSHLHADETGWRVNGNNHWLWSFSNDDVSFYKIDPTRSQDVVKNVLGEVFRGVLITDFYGAYNKIDCQKQKSLVPAHTTYVEATWISKASGPKTQRNHPIRP